MIINIIDNLENDGWLHLFSFISVLVEHLIDNIIFI
jgi:hypothetical protein